MAKQDEPGAGRPPIETEISLEAACVEAGHPLTYGELGDRVGLHKRTVQSRVRADGAGWAQTEGRQGRWYPASHTPALLSPEQVAALEAAGLW